MPHENLNLPTPTDGMNDFSSEEESRKRGDAAPPPADTAPPSKDVEGFPPTRPHRRGSKDEDHSLPVTTLPPTPPETVRAAEEPSVRLAADDVYDFPRLQQPPSRADQWDASLPSAVFVPPRTEPSSAAPQLVAAALLVVLIAAGGYFVFRNREAPKPVPTSTAAPAPTPDATAPLGAEAPAIDLPRLDESDAVVRGLVKELTSNPSVAAWLTTKNLIRNFTVVVTNIAAGEPAAGQVPALRPRGGFQVEERGKDLNIDPRSYARYLPLATAAGSVPPENLARLYTSLKPRIEEAYRELGRPDTTFDQTLERALVVLLKTPVPQGRIPVEPNGPVLYRFDDPVLERLTPSQKLLIRLGPDNQRTVQTSLRNIALALGIPAERLP